MEKGGKGEESGSTLDDPYGWVYRAYCNTPNLGCHEKLSLLFLFKSKTIISQRDTGKKKLTI